MPKIKVPEYKHSYPSINTNPEIPALKRLEDKTKINVRYVLIEPYVTAHIYFNPKIGELVYEIEEPILNEFEQKTLEELEAGMFELINLGTVVEKTQEALLSYLDINSKHQQVVHCYIVHKGPPSSF